MPREVPRCLRMRGSYNEAWAISQRRCNRQTCAHASRKNAKVKEATQQIVIRGRSNGDIPSPSGTRDGEGRYEATAARDRSRVSTHPHHAVQHDLSSSNSAPRTSHLTPHSRTNIGANLTRRFKGSLNRSFGRPCEVLACPPRGAWTRIVCRFTDVLSPTIMSTTASSKRVPS